MAKLVVIKSAKYISDYKIQFVFSNGRVKTIDFRSFILNNKSPYVTPFKNKKRFADFQITSSGDISWNDYDMCFTSEYLLDDSITTEIPAPNLNKFILKSFSKRKAKELIEQ